VDDRSLVFLEIMIALAAVGIIAFAVFLVTQYARRPRQAGTGGGAATPSPQWYEFLLAAAALLVVVVIVSWQFWPDTQTGLPADDWRVGSQSPVFLTVMAIAAALGLIGFVIFAFVRSSQNAGRIAAQAAPVAAAQTAEPGAAVHESPSAVRLLGLLLLGIALLLVCWAYVPLPLQFALMVMMVYPASLAVALVLLFDKATRAWSVKSGAASVREWILCDALVIFLILGFLNLLAAPGQETYSALFWDFLFVALFFLVFWLLDRKETRYRFLFAYVFVTLIPILLLIWRSVLEIPAPEALSWWGTIWPFFILGIIFLVLEIISLVATRDSDHQVVPAVKDALFVVIYAILLLTAIPDAG